MTDAEEQRMKSGQWKLLKKELWPEMKHLLAKPDKSPEEERRLDELIESIGKETPTTP